MSHKCHWPGCAVEVPPKMWGCKKHWFALPDFIRKKIWKEYVPGQEITKNPSKSYLVAARAAQKWIEWRDEFGHEMATKQFREYIDKHGWPDKPKKEQGE